MTTKELICAEIKKLQDIFVETAKGIETEDEATVYSMCAVEFGDELLAFLDTLPDEPVTDCHDLNQSSPLSNLPRHIADEAEDHSGSYKRIYRRMDETERWRREHPDEYEKQLNDLLSTSNLAEAAEKSWVDYEYREDPRGLYSSCYIDGFIAGAELQKRKMMEGAVEEEVQEVYRDDDGIHCCVSVGTGYKPGAIVYVITIPKEDKKNEQATSLLKDSARILSGH